MSEPATDKCPECRGPTKHHPEWNTIRVLGCGGDYEDWPCPKCRPKEYEDCVRRYYAN